jgi:hypothetical protein
MPGVRAAITAILLLACNDASDVFDAGDASDASTDVAPDVDRAVCTVSIADYCNVRPCPADEDAGIADLCANNGGIVSVCGGVVVSVSIDFGSGYVFDNGVLTTIFSYNNAKTTCIAGTIGSNVSSVGCSFTTNACLADAGDASLDQ